MKDRQYDNPIGFRTEIYGIWEASNVHAANRAVLDWISIGMIRCKCDCMIYLRRELGTKSGLSFLVPQRC